MKKINLFSILILIQLTTSLSFAANSNISGSTSAQSLDSADDKLRLTLYPEYTILNILAEKEKQFNFPARIESGHLMPDGRTVTELPSVPNVIQETTNTIVRDKFENVVGNNGETAKAVCEKKKNSYISRFGAHEVTCTPDPYNTYGSYNMTYKLSETQTQPGNSEEEIARINKLSSENNGARDISFIPIGDVWLDFSNLNPEFNDVNSIKPFNSGGYVGDCVLKRYFENKDVKMSIPRVTHLHKVYKMDYMFHDPKGEKFYFTFKTARENLEYQFTCPTYEGFNEGMFQKKSAQLPTALRNLIKIGPTQLEPSNVQDGKSPQDLDQFYKKGTSAI